MTVHFIGAGPGAADLMTLRGQRIIGACGVCVYAGALVPDEVLTWCAPGAVLVDSQHMELTDIIDVMRKAHDEGHDVARLHSGDPSVYSAVAEQMRRLDTVGVPYTMVPGVPAFAAAAAALGRELTVPQVAQSVVLTRIARNATAMPEGEKLSAFAATGTTLAIHLAIQRIDDVVAELVPFYGAHCPVAVCGFVSHPTETILTGTLETIAKQVADEGLTKQSIIIVGPALTASVFPDSHLYSATRQCGKATSRG